VDWSTTNGHPRINAQIKKVNRKIDLLSVSQKSPLDNYAQRVVKILENT